ncbi:Macrophage colony-stimulating factor 1 [Bagarius yarrelli]|uniref:Macrophage colony-stimulating factor 1 n=1 Tax=Bagarius yarrelli TaxID=175774 RepID=A0A556U261_BAGYA|nr:Macrophage colony-stimulating factor 1 [Bagarius yarrelli]
MPEVCTVYVPCCSVGFTDKLSKAMNTDVYDECGSSVWLGKSTGMRSWILMCLNASKCRVLLSPAGTISQMNRYTSAHLLHHSQINNQLRNSCSISYMFIEKKHLNSVCYVKAALPRVLDLLSAHFRYSRGSENALSVLSLQNLIHNIYSQHCVPPLNEELEESPVVFLKQFTDSPVQALQRAEEVLDLYLQLITQTHTALDWSCSMEYSYTYTTFVITELPSTHSTEAILVMLGQNEQNSSVLSFYKLGFIVLAVIGGIVLLIAVFCLIRKKVGSPEVFGGHDVYVIAALDH